MYHDVMPKETNLYGQIEFIPQLNYSQQSQSILPYTYAKQEQPYSLQPLYVDRTVSNREQSEYEKLNEPRAPPPYTAAVEPSLFPNLTQQQQQFSLNNKNRSSKHIKAISMPFSKGYKWPRSSMDLVCPKCGASVKTRLETKVTAITIIAAIILCLLSCFLAFLPFCIKACKKSIHYCPYCNSPLGIRRELR